MFQPGDLLRMCTVSEFYNEEHELINWCYGIYIDTVEELHVYDGFSDCSESYDRVLYNGCVMKVDAFWHMERIS